jgi:hypothetical protein
VTIVRMVSDVAQTTLDNLAAKKKGRLLTHLTVLSELARSAPAVFETKADETHRFVMQDVIFAKSPSSEVSRCTHSTTVYLTSYRTM